MNLQVTHVQDLDQTLLPPEDDTTQPGAEFVEVSLIAELTVFPKLRIPFTDPIIQMIVFWVYIEVPLFMETTKCFSRNLILPFRNNPFIISKEIDCCNIWLGRLTL